jgi:peptide/nickel transport system substrate-binding protein
MEPDVVRIHMNALPKSLNPYLTSAGPTIHLTSRIMQTLGVYNPDKLTLEPTLVKLIPVRQRISEGAFKGMTSYTFDLQEEARWDNGTPVTAADVVFTLKVIFHPGMPELEKWRGYFAYLHAVVSDVAEPRRFSMIFSTPYILDLASICQIPILPRYVYDADNLLGSTRLEALMVRDSALLDFRRLSAFADTFRAPRFSSDISVISGSGPYRVVQFSDQQVTLEKKQAWWGDALVGRFPYLAAYPKSLQYRLVRDETALETLLKTRELDLVYGVNPLKYVIWSTDTTFTNYYAFERRWSPAYSRILLNLSRPILTDKRVRKALALSVDYNFLISQVYQGFAERVVGPVHPSKAYYAADLTPYSFNVGAARQLLGEAGWSDTDGDGILDKDMGNGKRAPLRLRLMATTSVTAVRDVCSRLQQSARLSGFDLEIESADLSVAVQRSVAGDFDAFVGAAALSTGLDDFYQQFHSGSLAPQGDNRSRFAHAEADSLMSVIRITDDEKIRNRLYGRLQAIFHEELPEIFLFAGIQRYLVARNLDYVLTPERPGFYEQLFRFKK